jgi:hypothetical protein
MAKIVFMWTPETIPVDKLRMILPDNYPIELFDPQAQYPANTVFYYDMYGGFHHHIPAQLAQGHKIVFDAKNEHYVHTHLLWVLYKFLQHPGQGCFVISGDKPDPLPGVKIIATPYWYWIMDQFNFRQTGLDRQLRQPNITHKFFMSISLQRPERDYLYDALGDLQSQSIHSYRARDVHLPGDRMDLSIWQRYVNPDWIDSTAFTLAVETYVDSTAVTGFSLTQNNHLFLCEKSYRPMAAQHPILMASTQGNLAYLRGQGFETFPELFDETYDDIPDWRTRMQRIVEIVRDFNIGSVDHPRIREKTQHNHARFFDRTLTRQLAEQTIQQPLFEFIDE